MRQLLPGILALLLCAAMHNCMAQFEGIITYSIQYTAQDEAAEAYIDALPDESTLLLKDEHIRFNQAVAGGGQQAFLANTNLQTSTLLMNFLGQQYQVKMNREDVMKLKQINKFKFEKTAETKTIAGYECIKALAFSEMDTLEVFYTTAIQAPKVLPQFEDLPGLPLQYEVNQGNMHLTYTCSSISSEPVDASQFQISKQVKVIPFDKFAESFALPK